MTFTPTVSEAERLHVERLARDLAEGAISLDALVAQLGLPDWSVRRAVVATLAAAGDAAAPLLVEALISRRDDETVIAATVDALAASVAALEQSELFEPLRQATDPAVLADYAQILGRRQDPRAVARLVPLVVHDDDNVSVAAIEALGRVGGRAAVEPLLGILRSGNFFRIFPAIDVLGRSGDPRVVPALAELLDNRRYRLEAARALGRTGDKHAVAALSRLFEGNESDVRVAALAVSDLRTRFTQLYGLAAPIEDAFRRAVDRPATARRVSHALATADAHERCALATMLGLLHDESAVFALTTLLGVEDGAVAAAAAEALRANAAVYETGLAEALRGGDGPKLELILPLVSHPSSAQAISACLESGDSEVRLAACDALARAGNPEVVPALFRRLTDDNPGVVQAAVAAIQSLGSADTERLALDAAHAADAPVRRWALRILAYFGSAAALDVFLRGIEDDDPRVRDAAIAGLPFVDDPRAREALFEKTRHPVPSVRAAAARALGQCGGDARAQSLLLRAIEDTDAWVRYYACQALGRLGVEAAVGPLARSLHDEAGHVRVAAVEALSHFETDVARGHLVTAARAEDPDMRRAALVGLGMNGRAAALATLLDAAGADDAATRLVALAALAGQDAPIVIASLARAATDADQGVRAVAIGVLAAHRRHEATAALIELLRRDRSSTRLQDALALPSAERIKGIAAALSTADDETAPILTSALVRMSRPDAAAAVVEAMASPHLPARKAAAMTLAGLGTPAAVAALRAAALHDADPEMRRICALVLA